MADGTTKPIEAVRIGDSVMSRNEQTGKTEPEPISAVIRHGNTPTITLALSDGDHIVTTAPHPFYVIGKGFTEARSLRAGEAIASRAGEPATITAIDHTAAVPVYNLTVAGDHTYFVGRASGGLWAHNVNCNFPQSKLQHEFKHAPDFGVNGNWNSQNGQAFEQALQTHIDNAPVQIPGTFRGNIPVTHFYDPATNNWVAVDPSDNFVAGWNLGPNQVQDLMTNGNVR
jgi:hypothetical protein